MDPIDPVLSKREQKGEEIATCLFKRLDLQYVKQTGSLFPSSSLRHRCTREQLSWMQHFRYEGVERLLTVRLARAVLQKLLDWGLEIPSAPGMDTEKWLDVSSKVLHRMLKKARRGSGSGGAMDEEETQVVGDDGLDSSEDRGPHAALQLYFGCMHSFMHGGLAMLEAEGLEFCECSLDPKLLKLSLCCKHVHVHLSLVASGRASDFGAKRLQCLWRLYHSVFAVQPTHACSHYACIIV